jgi:hypothetical protein
MPCETVIGRNGAAVRTLDDMTTTTYETTAPATRPTLGRRLTALLERTRADRSDLARTIEAYPATRSASMVVLPVNPR